jgi:hypothetical protein
MTSAKPPWAGRCAHLKWGEAGINDWDWDWDWKVSTQTMTDCAIIASKVAIETEQTDTIIKPQMRVSASELLIVTWLHTQLTVGCTGRGDPSHLP